MTKRSTNSLHYNSVWVVFWHWKLFCMQLKSGESSSALTSLLRCNLLGQKVLYLAHNSCSVCHRTAGPARCSLLSSLTCYIATSKVAPTNNRNFILRVSRSSTIRLQNLASEIVRRIYNVLGFCCHDALRHIFRTIIGISTYICLMLESLHWSFQMALVDNAFLENRAPFLSKLIRWALRVLVYNMQSTMKACVVFVPLKMVMQSWKYCLLDLSLT